MEIGARELLLPMSSKEQGQAMNFWKQIANNLLEEWIYISSALGGDFNQDREMKSINKVSKLATHQVYIQYVSNENMWCILKLSKYLNKSGWNSRFKENGDFFQRFSKFFFLPCDAVDWRASTQHGWRSGLSSFVISVGKTRVQIGKISHQIVTTLHHLVDFVTWRLDHWRHLSRCRRSVKSSSTWACQMLRKFEFWFSIDA